jgi:tetratricopeptide (TPR) repeat protein
MSTVTRLRLGLGKLRRFYLHMFNRDYLRRNHARRKGECRRCGLCCELMFTCPYLEGSNGDTSCACHGTRWDNCKIFPVDERDLADRDRVSDDGPCGFRFDPPMRPQRWLFTLAVAALAGLAATSRATAASPGPGLPLNLKSSFGGERMPSGWRIESGKWEFSDGALDCLGTGTVAAFLRKDMLPVAGAAFRVELWVELGEPGTPGGNGPALLALSLGALRAGLGSPTAPFVALGDDAARSPPCRPPEGRVRIAIETDRGLVSVRVGRRVTFLRRDVFARLAGSAPREVFLHARRGVRLYAVRLRATRANERPKALADADRAWLAGEIKKASELYEDVLATDALATDALAADALPRSRRAEAAYKLGAALGKLGSTEEAAAAFDRAQKLAPRGPWGERARIALGEAALEAGRPDTALRFALLAANEADSGLEDWPGFRALVSRGREAMVERGQGPRATFRLLRLAERIEWARTSPALTRWAWEEVAHAYSGRGLDEQAGEVRKRADRLFGGLARSEEPERP